MTTAISDIQPGSGFLAAEGEEPHKRRRADILRAHPEIRALIGPNPASALLVVALVALQLGAAALLSRHEAPALVVVAVAFVFGACCCAMLNALIHDASHEVVLRGAAANRAIALVANLPLVSWAAMPFFRYHSWHHDAMGDYEMDVGIPTHFEAAWVGNSAWRKAVWLAAFPFFQWLRTRKFRLQAPVWDRWMVANAVIQTAADVAIVYVLGIEALVYLALSYGLAVGFHPLGTRVIQEHFIVADGEETNNYVGWANLLECNFGYHVEHHDFPGIPWNRLPRLGRIAPEFYAARPVFRSRVALMIDFIRNPRWHLHRHAVRNAPA
ncbi:MAG TPA: fatty acid desaturase [Candidatus Omnitrophota bacterium]|nr:fatty acid desaturase [Candidatus Omnitrophota bacterium]